jgi:hypothetical protein
MHFSSLLIISVAAIAFAAPGQEIPNALNEISARDDHSNPVSLEFGRRYTKEELNVLQTRSTLNAEALTPHQLSPSVAKREARTFGLLSTFLCPTYGTVQ